MKDYNQNILCIGIQTIYTKGILSQKLPADDFKLEKDMSEFDESYVTISDRRNILDAEQLKQLYDV